MADSGLTEKQLNFIKTFITMPLIFGRDEAAQKREEWAGEFEQFNSDKAKAKTAVDAIADGDIRKSLLDELDRTQASLLEGDGKPDFKAAGERLAFVESAAAIQPAHQACLTLIDTVAQKVTAAIALKPANADEIQSTLDLAKDQARKGASDHDAASLATCKKTLETVTALTDKVQEDHTAKEAALASLKPIGDGFVQASAAIATDLGGDLTPELKEQARGLSALFALTADATRQEAEAALAKAPADLAAFKSDGTAAGAAYKAWIAAKLVFDNLFKVLSNHKRKGDATFVAGLVSTLETDFEAARKKAEEQFKYAEATTDITGLPDRIRKAISVADDVAQYEAVRADREKRVKELPAAGTVTEGAPRDKVSEAKAFYDDAVAEFLAGESDKDVAHITRAVALLEKVPDGVRAALDLAKYAKLYEDAYQSRVTEKATMDNWGPVYQQHLSLELALFTKLVDEASLPNDLAARKPAEYRAAAVKLDSLSSYMPTLETKADLVEDYLEAMETLDDNYNEIDAITPEDGEAAVAEYLLKMGSDWNFARARFVAKDYSGALVAATNTFEDHEAQKKLAEIAKEYLATRKTVKQKVDKIKSDGAGDADEAAASIETMIRAAETEATAKHWQEALDLINKAESRSGAAEAVGTAVKALNDVWENVESEAPDAAHAKFMIIHDKVDGDDGDNLFSGELAAEKKNADDALAGAKSGGDAVAAADTISSALTQVFWVGQQLAHREAYKTLYDVVKQAHEVDLIKPEVNKDNIIQWYIDKIGNSKTAAKAKADAPKLDFPKALKNLAVAERQILRAEQISTDWVKLRPTLVKINDLQSELDDAILDGNFATEKARLIKYSNGIYGDIKAAKFEEVRAQVKEGGVFAESLEKVTDKYRSIKSAMATQIAPMRAQITEVAAPHAKDARIQVAKLDSEMTDLLAAHASQAAWNLAGDLLGAIESGVALNKLAEQYFTLKKTCEDTLSDYENKNSLSNTKVTERLEQLNEHFEGGSIFDEPGDLKSTVSTWEASQNFNGGIKRLKPIPAECAKLDADIKDYDDCKAQRDKSGAEIGKVLKAATGDIAPIAARLRGKHQNAVKIMDAGNYALALMMFTELEGDATKAAESAAAVAALQQEITELSGAVPDDQLGPKVTSAKAQIEALRATTNSIVADKELKAAEKAIIDAGLALGKDPSAVRDAVSLALKELRDAMQRIELFRQLETAATYAKAQLTKLGEHKRKAFIKADIAEQNLKIIAQMAKAGDRSSTIDMVMNEIEEVMASVHKIRRIADNYQEFVALKKKADDDLVALEKSEARYAVREAIPEIRKHLAEAASEAQKREHIDAIAALRRAQIDLSAASLEAKLEKGEAPSKEEITAILNQPAGDKKLDKIMAGLDAKAQRGVLVAVMKVRFGCDIEVLKRSPDTVDADYRKWLIDTNTKTDAERLVELAKLADATDGEANEQYGVWLAANGGKSDTEKLAELKDIIEATGDSAGAKFDDWLAESNAKTDVEKDDKSTQMHADNVQTDMDENGQNLIKMYQMMADCPTSDTLDNDSMLTLSTSGGHATGSSFASNISLDEISGDVVVTKKVVMREGDVGNSGFYGIALPFELDEIDVECKPVDADPLSFFSWNTLHEVGHAVDDKLGAMKNGGNAKAGWQEHGANVLPIAKEAAKDVNYSYDEKYIAAYLSGVTDPPIPEAPDPNKAEEWERKRMAVRNWADMMRESRNPWQSAEIAKSTMLKNGRVYQESYENSWTSYDYAERKKGVSGYQFRAPGEWFSELYAAFHSGKMNPDHPHRDWIRSN